MKRIILLLAMLLPVMAMAGVPEIDKLATKWNGTDGVTVVNLEGAMLQAMIGAETDDATANEAMKHLNDLQIIVCENKAHIDNLTKDIDKLLKKADLQEVTNIKEEDTSVIILSNKEGNITTDLVIYVKEKDDVALISLSGEFTDDMMKDVINIGDSLDF